MNRKLTLDIIQERLNSNGKPHIKILKYYGNSRGKFYCEKCKNNWRAHIGDAVYGKYGCNKCNILSKPYSTEEINEILKKQKIEVVIYRGFFNKSTFYCKVCKSKFKGTLHSLIKRTKVGCNKCCKKTKKPSGANNYRVKQAKIKWDKLVPKMHPTIDIQGSYTGDNKQIKCICKICNHKWSPTGGSLKTGRGCRPCYLASTKGVFTKTLAEYKRELKLINPNVVCVSNIYLGRGVKIEHKCVKCTCRWFSVPANMLKPQGCPNCNQWSYKLYQLGSKQINLQGYENHAIDWLLYNTKLTPKLIIAGRRSLIPQIPYWEVSKWRTYYPDIWIPSKNLIIEVKGLYTLLKDLKTFNNVKRKYQAVVDRRYKFKLMLMSKEDNLVLKRNLLKSKYSEVKSYYGV